MIKKAAMIITLIGLSNVALMKASDIALQNQFTGGQAVTSNDSSQQSSQQLFGVSNFPGQNINSNTMQTPVSQSLYPNNLQQINQINQGVPGSSQIGSVPILGPVTVTDNLTRDLRLTVLGMCVMITAVSIARPDLMYNVVDAIINRNPNPTVTH